MVSDLGEIAGNIRLVDAAELLRQAERVTIVTHRNPDGDAVGSASALGSALITLGKEVRLVCPDPLPPYLLASPRAANMTQTLGDDTCDLFVCIDVSDPALLYDLPVDSPDFFTGQNSLNLDHHLSNLRYARFNYVDPSAASASEIIADLLALLGVPIQREEAEDLLYGIVNDTHSFQNSNTTPRTLRLTADLVEAGADLSAITYNLLIARNPSAARLWAAVLPTLDFADTERVAFLTVSLAALARAGATMVDADGLVEFLRSVRTVELAILFKQTGPDSYRLSIRTSSLIDATLIAGRYGGGGHRRAAGGDAKGTEAEIKLQLLAAYHLQHGDA